MRVRESDAPCRCPESAKREFPVTTYDGATRTMRVCSRCGHVESMPDDAWQSQEFPEEASLPPALMRAASSNEGNRQMLIERTQQEIRKLQQLIPTLEDGAALTEARDALQFELETLALLQLGDLPDSEAGQEPQRGDEPTRDTERETPPP